MKLYSSFKFKEKNQWVPKLLVDSVYMCVYVIKDNQQGVLCKFFYFVFVCMYCVCCFPIHHCPILALIYQW